MSYYDPYNPRPPQQPKARWWRDKQYPDMLSGRAIVLAVLAVIVLGLGGLIGGLLALNNHTVHVSCLRLHEQTGLETKVARSGTSTECYVRLDETWTPYDRWRVVDGSTNYGASD